uniref:RRM domain-containing protein n=1 Tax=Brassica oleracea var. oleracea TaxID=109376 RepID=A0A0D3AZN5_BRAOL
MATKEGSRIFVGGLSPEVTERDLQRTFGRFGDILDCQSRFWLTRLGRSASVLSCLLARAGIPDLILSGELKMLLSLGQCHLCPSGG